MTKYTWRQVEMHTANLAMWLTKANLQPGKFQILQDGAWSTVIFVDQEETDAPIRPKANPPKKIPRSF